MPETPRYARCAAAWEAMQQLTPHLAAMHPMQPEHIHEELELMGPNLGSYNYEWLSHSPRWRDAYYAEDQTRPVHLHARRAEAAAVAAAR